jgi:DNA-binding MarR family transcriptional regulator
MTRWLSQDELAAWLPLVGVMLRFNSALDSQLVRDSDLTHFDYLCLAMLSEEDGHVTSMSKLAGRTNASLSRLSHVVSKLERRGFVSRCPSDISKRVTNVRMTEQGYDVLVAAAPGHVEHVRRLIFDGLAEDDVAALRRLMLHILQNIECATGKDRDGAVRASLDA